MERDAAGEILDLGKVKTLKRDFNVLLKNLPKLTSYPITERWSRALALWVRRFHDYIYEHFIPELENKRAEKNITSEWSAYWSSEIRSACWELGILSSPLGFPDNYWTEGALQARFVQDLPAWERRARNAARKAWKGLRSFVDWYEGRTQKTYTVGIPQREQITLEGFSVIVKGYDPEQNPRHVKEMEIIKASLRRYRKRARTVFPWLLRYQLPLVLEFHCGLDWSGRYEQTYIKICPHTFENPEQGAYVLAHEQGHHYYQTKMGNDEHRLMRGLYLGDLIDLDLREVLRIWPEGLSRTKFENSIKKSNPYLVLQLESLAYHSSLKHLLFRNEFQEYLDKGGNPLVRVQGNPISGYAAKNTEEAFCDMLGKLVGYGPRTLPAKILSWVQYLLPQIRVAKTLQRSDEMSRLGRSIGIRIAKKYPQYRQVLRAALSKSAENLPADVERYVKEHKEKGMEESKAWAIAWSRYCKYTNPGSSHCKQKEYFPGKNASEQMLRDSLIRVAYDNPEMRERILPLVIASQFHPGQRVRIKPLTTRATPHGYPSTTAVLQSEVGTGYSLGGWDAKLPNGQSIFIPYEDMDTVLVRMASSRRASSGISMVGLWDQNPQNRPYLEEKAYNLGMEAKTAGSSLDKNSFPKGHPLFTAWRDGWQETIL